MKIFKYDLVIADENLIVMPAGALPLCVDIQQGKPKLWALVNEKAPDRQARIVTARTGEPADNVQGMQYVGTYQLGGFVGHVFYK